MQQLNMSPLFLENKNAYLKDRGESYYISITYTLQF